ncbi:ead/Ea22-like family protein [Salmonella enterica]|uniref:ead/Ea22-like family protein n=3 Tax=Salmonella TaxID=590 RepID=UPI0015914BE9|nr:ead/Ea22-like family protein [Salmonella enterica]EEL1744075.1 ead/Ea22-like family protein [Salmonella enterica subsp. enterica serovar Schwarzengrund]EFI4880252.1 ead/Ea22-like family protein [Salmonella enterica]EFR8684974.1 ead/Ea22-like family protein [Salmonella enterica]EGQ6642163.1 ead/Ea22-like family protein [Salmonella enterica]EGW6869707.1 ead/Ea22-like family protein [Salmonella enterica]
MTIDKQALREEFRLMQAHYSDPADRARQVIYIAAEALLDELDKKQQYIKLRDQENEDIALTVGKLRVELEHYKSREERVTKLVLDNSTSLDALYKKLEAAEKRIAEQSAIVAAAEKLVRCKGRYHSELNYRALAKLFGVVTPDLPPLEHENVHYADAAEVEITALRQRIAELEARKVNLSKLSVGEVMYVSGFSRDYAEGWCAGNDNAIHEIRTAGIKVKGG